MRMSEPYPWYPCYYPAKSLKRAKNHGRVGRLRVEYEYRGAEYEYRYAEYEESADWGFVRMEHPPRR